MRHSVTVLALSVLAIGVYESWEAPAALAGGGARHSGTVVAVDPQARTLILSELADGGKVQTLNIQIGPEARLVRSERLPEVADPEHPFKDTAIGIADLRPGDFVVVELSDAVKGPVADSVSVTSPAGPK
jgi:hypothetical protein